MTELQIYLLIAPVLLVAFGGGLAVYARYDAVQMTRPSPAGPGSPPGSRFPSQSACETHNTNIHMASTSGAAMSYDRTASKRAINVSLNDDLVRQAKLYTRNLSGTLEDLLDDFVTRERARRRDEDAALDRVIGALNAFHSEHGLLSDEFPSL